MKLHGLLFILVALFCDVKIALGEVKIGIIADLSGPAATVKDQVIAGARLAENELKKEGKDVSVFIGDSAFQTTSGISEAQKMLYADKVDALYVLFSKIVEAVSPVAKNSNKLLVGSSGGVKFLDSNPNAFKVFLDYQIACAEVAKLWKAQGISRPALLRFGFELGERCRLGVTSVYGEVPEIIFNPGEPLSSPVLSLKSKKIDGIFFMGYEQDGLNLAKALTEIKYSPLITNHFDSLRIDRHLENYRGLLDKITTFGFADISSEFKQKIIALDSSKPEFATQPAAEAYLVVMQLYAAISQCPEGDINCQVQQMSESKPSELLGFKGYKNRIADFEYQYTSWKGGRATNLSSGEPNIIK